MGLSRIVENAAKAKGLSKSALAEASGVNRITFFRYLAKDDMPFSVLLAVSKTLQTHPASLIAELKEEDLPLPVVGEVSAWKGPAAQVAPSNPGMKAEMEALRKELADKKEIIELLKDKIELLEGKAGKQQAG